MEVNHTCTIGPVTPVQVEFPPTGELWEPGSNRPLNYPNPHARHQHIDSSSSLTHCLRVDSQSTQICTWTMLVSQYPRYWKTSTLV